MSAFKTLFKQTFIYGLATVLPRMLTFLLVPLYTDVLAVAVYGKVSIIFSWFAIFNVILAYGMETAFFRFFNKEDNKNKVVGTATISLLLTSLVIFVLAFLFQNQIATITDIKVEYIKLVVWILLLDALVIIPFAWLRATEKPKKYAVIKIANVAINIGLNIFFLLVLVKLAKPESTFSAIYKPDFEINYILIATLIASAITLLLMLPFYRKVKYTFDSMLWKRMLRYAFPILIAGLAYAVNETFDRILLDKLSLSADPEREIGMYSACYKLALFMTLFATAFRLGIEPYFFSHAKDENPQKNYARILEYFVVFGSVILLSVVVFADVIKSFIILDEAFWEAMWIVPIILIASFCLGIYHNLSVWYKITDKTKFGAYISVFGATITLILNYILIPIIGYKGSALATLSAYGSMMLLSYYYGRKYYPIPYNIKKIGLYLTISIGFSLLSFYGYRGNYYLGGALLMILFGMVWVFEGKEIKRLIKR